MRPADISYVDGREIVVDGKKIRVPSRATFADVRGADTLRVELDVEDAIGTDNRKPAGDGSPFATTKPERGDPEREAAMPKPYFIQMKGIARISGRLAGAPVAGSGTGFFETYR
jgi:hypothetical protein